MNNFNNNSNQNSYNNTPQADAGGNLGMELLKTIGISLLGGLIGGALWFGLSFLGRMAVISGVAAGLGGAFGGMSTGSNSRALKLTLGIVISLALFCAGVYLGIGVDIYKALEGVVPLNECINLIPDVFTDPDISHGFIFDIVIGIITYLVGLVAGIVKLKDIT